MIVNWFLLSAVLALWVFMYKMVFMKQISTIYHEVFRFVLIMILLILSVALLSKAISIEKFNPELHDCVETKCTYDDETFGFFTRTQGSVCEESWGYICLIDGVCEPIKLEKQNCVSWQPKKQEKEKSPVEEGDFFVYADGKRLCKYKGTVVYFERRGYYKTTNTLELYGFYEKDSSATLFPEETVTFCYESLNSSKKQPNCNVTKTITLPCSDYAVITKDLQAFKKQKYDFCHNNPSDSEKCECVTHKNFTSFSPVNEITITFGEEESVSPFSGRTSGICSIGEGFKTTCKVWNYSVLSNSSELVCVEAVPKVEE